MAYIIFVIAALALGLVALGLGNARERATLIRLQAEQDCLIQEAAFQRHEAERLQLEVDRLAFSWWHQEEASKEAEAWVGQAWLAWAQYDLAQGHKAQLEALSANLHWLSQSDWAYLAQVVGHPKGGQDVFGRWLNPRTGEWVPTLYK